MIVFHGATHLFSYPPKRPGASFAMLSMEQPKYAVVLGNVRQLNKRFDLLSTYSQEPVYPGTKIPNLPITYYPLHLVSAQAVLKAPKAFKDKTGYGTGESGWNAHIVRRCDGDRWKMLIQDK
jgi:hypothetical protein